MTAVAAIGTYLPTWGSHRGRQIGDDEDAVMLAVAAGRPALAASGPNARVTSVVLVSRDLQLLEGGNGAPVLAGLGLDEQTQIREVVGGASASLDEITGAGPDTLVIGEDADGPAGASAALCGDAGPSITASVELFEQLRGESTNQVDGARIGLAHNIGGPTAVSAVTILGSDKG